MKQWIPNGRIVKLETEKYRYEIGFYDHIKYGKKCFRIVKYTKAGIYVGHFVLINEDINAVFGLIKDILEG